MRNTNGKILVESIGNRYSIFLPTHQLIDLEANKSDMFRQRFDDTYFFHIL